VDRRDGKAQGFSIQMEVSAGNTVGSLIEIVTELSLRISESNLKIWKLTPTNFSFCFWSPFIGFR
jgi:hypothetical protein